jgi:molybdopterin-guanine dinucleotide biosynthesis protein A
MSTGAFDAIVLAGGSARRMGGADKPMLDVAGTPMLRLVLEAVSGARARVVVGPQRDITGVTWCQESPPGGGPVAAIAAGLPATSGATVVVLAADLPWIGPAITPLRTALDRSGADVAMLSSDGQLNYLAAAWRRSALVAVVHGIDDAAGASMRRLAAGARVVEVPDAGHWGEDCDTWTDLARARARRAEGSHL